MIGHVWERVSKCETLDATIVATCDAEIFDYISSIGGIAVMTSATHERASDRCAEALEDFEREVGRKFDIVVMVQGDEPMTHPDMISEALGPILLDPTINVVNLIANITSEEEFVDRNCIKVVTDLHSNALYFSREPIPTGTRYNDFPRKKQVCIIPFRRDFLFEYQRLTETLLEKIESIDMLRVLEHGYNVRMVPTEYVTRAVDTPEDLELVAKLMRQL